MAGPRPRARARGERIVVSELPYQANKAQPLDQYRSQRRGGKGKTATTMKEDERLVGMEGFVDYGEE